jgi:Tfp pilus assembly protein PilV
MNARARRRPPASEEGFALIEVVVSAAVLVILVLGVLAAVDAVSGTAGANQSKTVAATLAEKDLERLRG